MNLSDVLRNMATSSIAKDREAIARIEKAAGKDVYDILQKLESQELIVVNFETDVLFSLDKERTSESAQFKQLILSAGLMSAGLLCLVSLLFKPSIAIAVTPIGFVVGAASKHISLTNEIRHGIKNR